MSPVDRADTEYGISMRVAKHGLEVSRPSHDETPKGDVGSHSHKMTTQPSGPGLNILDPEDTRQSGSAETTRSRIASPARVRQNAGGHAADDDNQVTSGAADVPSQTHFVCLTLSLDKNLVEKYFWMVSSGSFISSCAQNMTTKRL